MTSRRGGALARVVIGVAVLGAVGAGVLIWGRGGGPVQLGADVYTASVQSFDITATASGELRAKRQTVLASQLQSEATIVEIVDEGARVSKGDVLIRLNSDDIESELEDERIQLEEARADMIAAESALAIQIEENNSALRKAQVELELAQVELQKYEAGDVVERRLELDLDLEKGHREVKRLTEKVERSRQLFEKDFLSKDELEKDEIELVEAQSALKKAEVAKVSFEQYTYRKERQKLESEVDDAQSELAKVRSKNQSELTNKESDVSTKKRQLALREDKVKKLEKQLEQCVIVAPTDGLVVYATSLEQFSWMNNQEPLNVGTKVSPNQELIMLPDTTDMIAVVKVAESLVGRVKPGQSALVTVDAAQGAQFTATVDSIGIMAQNSGGWRSPDVKEYEVKLDLQLGEKGHALKPSMRCEARVTLASVAEVVAVPLQAVFIEGPHQFVYAVDGDSFAQTPVRVGRRSETLAEIASGLGAGDRVLLREPPAAKVIKAKFEEPERGPGMAGGARPGQRGPGAQAAAPSGASAGVAATQAKAADGAKSGEAKPDKPKRKKRSEMTAAEVAEMDKRIAELDKEMEELSKLDPDEKLDDADLDEAGAEKDPAGEEEKDAPAEGEPAGTAPDAPAEKPAGSPAAGQ
ncbi:MAG: HlyD family efflux transporter periplasmic adaptor subunit [Planctomycetota bacterium]|nr:HlyD family efflux transporter periplasmic adaptor subunit [Planctomycetota bacterium]